MQHAKRIGLALVAVLAMSAVLASAAQAEFTVGAGAARVTATQTNKNRIIFGATGELECPNATGEGTVSEGTFESIEFTPNFGTGCTAFGQPMDVNPTGGCTYLLTTSGQVHICPNGGHIVITVTSGGASVCTITFGAQTMSTTLANSGTSSEMDILMTVAATGLSYEVTNDSGNNCGGNGTHTDAEYKGKTTLQAEEANGTKVSLTHD